jgi:hypothetical protein
MFGTKIHESGLTDRWFLHTWKFCFCELILFRLLRCSMIVLNQEVLRRWAERKVDFIFCVGSQYTSVIEACIQAVCTHTHTHTCSCQKDTSAVK